MPKAAIRPVFPSWVAQGRVGFQATNCEYRLCGRSNVSLRPMLVGHVGPSRLGPGQVRGQRVQTVCGNAQMPHFFLCDGSHCEYESPLARIPPRRIYHNTTPNRENQRVRENQRKTKGSVFVFRPFRQGHGILGQRTPLCLGLNGRWYPRLAGAAALRIVSYACPPQSSSLPSV